MKDAFTLHRVENLGNFLFLLVLVIPSHRVLCSSVLWEYYDKTSLVMLSQMLTFCGSRGLNQLLTVSL